MSSIVRSEDVDKEEVDVDKERDAEDYLLGEIWAD
jgi:hypothetical protein